MADKLRIENVQNWHEPQLVIQASNINYTIRPTERNRASTVIMNNLTLNLI